MAGALGTLSRQVGIYSKRPYQVAPPTPPYKALTR